MNWHLQYAKDNPSKPVQQVVKDGSPTVTLRGKPTAESLSVEHCQGMRGKKPSFVEHLLNGPLLGDEIVEAINWRDKRPSRSAIEF